MDAEPVFQELFRRMGQRTSLRALRGEIVKTVVLEMRFLKETLDDAAPAMKSGRADREARNCLRFVRIALARAYSEVMGIAQSDV